jgi:predicted ATP-grasp superfamily ATP-dependent carboligase
LRLDGESEMIDESFFPCVAKPIVGAGSEGVQLIATAEELERIPKPVLIQRYVEGDHVSVSVIARLGEAPIILDPGRQVFDADPFGVHLKTEYPLDQRRKERAVALAMKVAKAFDRTRGYYGIDMVLAADPADDVVIEINPRLTSSYYWLRKWNGENIAAKFPF